MKKALVIFVGFMLCVNVGFFFFKSGRAQSGIPKESPVEIPILTQPIPFPKKEHKSILPDFIQVQSYRQSDGSVHGDIISHAKEPFGDRHGRMTNAHESAHGIHSFLRNQNNQSKRMNGFYALNGRGVLIEEPNIKMTHVVPFIPENVRSYRYDLYMVKQLGDWNDVPLYIMDEWNAYVLGGMTGVDDVQKGVHKDSWTDGVSGCLDFSIYSVALGMSVQKNDPNYWNANVQFKSFLRWNLGRANETYLLGSKMKEFRWEKQDQLLKEFLTSDATKGMRDFLRTEMEGVWLDRKTVAASNEEFHYAAHERVELKAGCTKCRH